MSFLDLCERAALLAEREAALLRQQQDARIGSRNRELREIGRKLAATRADKRVTIRLALTD